MGIHFYKLSGDGKLIFNKANPAADRILGIDHNQFRGKTFEEANPAMAKSDLAEKFKRVASEGTSWYSEQVDLKDSIINSSFEIVAFQTDVDKIAIMFRDIKERIRNERIMEENQKRYQTIFESAYDAIFIMAGNVFVDCNTRTLEMFDCKRDEIIGKHPSQFSPAKQGDGRDSMEKAAEKITAAFNGAPQFFEWKHCKLDGAVFDAEVSLNKFTVNDVDHLLAIVRDITARKKYEKALEISEKRYQELFEAVMEGIAVVNEKETILYSNPAFTKILEVDDARKLIGRSFYDFVPKDQMDKISKFNVDRKKGKSSQYEMEIVTDKGNKRYILATVSPRYNQEGEFSGAIGAMIDITETKNLQELVNRAQRLETAGRISGQIAHDFNNLLGPLTAYPDIIRTILTDEHPAMRYISKMEQAATYIAEINQELLVLGRRGHYNLEPLNLNEVIEQVVNNMRSLRDAKQLSISLSDNLMNINGGKSQISRVIANLLANAWDALDPEGKIEIKTENYYVDDSVARYGMIPKGEFVKVTISDNGCGIPDDIRPKIFDPFFTTKKADIRKGSGLGLSVVHAVVEDHGGFVDIESEIGMGTKFYLYFPITRDKVKDKVLDKIEGGSESILVVDDDQAQREIAQVLLSEMGYIVQTVESGELAVQVLKERKFDLLILDMIMPDSIDGAETYRRALEINPNQKAIIVSGYAETDQVKDALDLGAGSYIRKPLTMKTIAKAVRSELDRNKADNHSRPKKLHTTS